MNSKLPKSKIRIVKKKIWIIASAVAVVLILLLVFGGSKEKEKVLVEVKVINLVLIICKPPEYSCSGIEGTLNFSS